MAKEKTEKITKPRCGLCGSARKKLTKTECCGNWICDDEDNYVIFSYARNSCKRNHDRYTLCSTHYHEGHKGDWRQCKKCLRGYEHVLEMYVWYGTNEYNFKKLENPPAFKLTYCSKCGKRIVLPDGGYSDLCGVIRCDSDACDITEEERGKIIADYTSKERR